MAAVVADAGIDLSFHKTIQGRGANGATTGVITDTMVTTPAIMPGHAGHHGGHGPPLSHSVRGRQTTISRAALLGTLQQRPGLFWLGLSAVLTTEIAGIGARKSDRLIMRLGHSHRVEGFCSIFYG